MTARKGNNPNVTPVVELEAPEAPKRNLHLCCTYCGSELNVTLTYESTGYNGENVFEAIECENYACGAEWNKDGTVKKEPFANQ